ncbi:MAG: thioredoxin family protein [Candidatus Helarchaeota archaeon]|nr:thioredoxin family protein [Candidatus Helarchaeota archaeon]
MSRYRLPSEQMLKRKFAKLKNPIQISIFISPQEDHDSFSVFEFMRAITNQDSKIELNLITKKMKPELFEQYHIEEVPAIVIEDTGIQYTGVPSGPESMMFIQTLIMKSTENSGVGAVISKVLDSLKKPVQLRTIITSQCTICPLAVKIGNMLSLESAFNGNGKVRHEIIEALEHMEYVSNYDLSAVPIILINNEIAFNGIPDVDRYVSKIAEAGR